MSDSAASAPGPTATAAAATIREKFDHLRELLRRMFQLDRGDPDFGLYRIMKMKPAEVSAFRDCHPEGEWPASSGGTAAS